MTEPSLPHAEPSAILIGCLVPLTPPGWTEAGRHLLAGLELAAAQVNDAGGIAGEPLELLVRDTAASPQRAAATVAELDSLGVAAVAGEYHSVAARAAAAQAESLGLPFLCSSAVLDALTDEPAQYVARLAPAQSRGWRVYAEFLLAAGHRRIAVAAERSVYWAAGTAILADFLPARGGTLTEVTLPVSVPAAACDEIAASGATAVLLLAGYPEPAVPLVRAIRADPRLSGITIGAPAGQPELEGWPGLLGGGGDGISFLRYLPERLSPLGARVEAALREQLGGPPSFVAFEGYDTIVVLAAMLRECGTDRRQLAGSWPQVEAEGTRGPVQFSRVPGISVWQWAWPPVQVADRDLERPGGFRVLHSAGS